MILDSSAVVAVMFKEPGYEHLIERLDRAGDLAIGAPTLVEATIVSSARLGRDARGLVARFLQEAGIWVVAFTDAQHALAVEAWRRYGKGRHRASLNFGDCLAYAVARHAGKPLLCRGEDFARTDLPLA